MKSLRHHRESRGVQSSWEHRWCLRTPTLTVNPAERNTLRAVSCLSIASIFQSFIWTMMSPSSIPAFFAQLNNPTEYLNKCDLIKLFISCLSWLLIPLSCSHQFWTLIPVPTSPSCFPASTPELNLVLLFLL